MFRTKIRASMEFRKKYRNKYYRKIYLVSRDWCAYCFNINLIVCYSICCKNQELLVYCSRKSKLNFDQRNFFAKHSWEANLNLSERWVCEHHFLIETVHYFLPTRQFEEGLKYLTRIKEKLSHRLVPLLIILSYPTQRRVLKFYR